MSGSTIDFSALTLRDALDLAIGIEEEAQERYEELADQMELHHTPEAASFFRQMSRSEAQHGSELRERRRRLYRDASRAVAGPRDVKAPGYDEVRAFMTLRQAVQTALRAEETAQAFFGVALPQVRDPEVRALFEALRDEEARLHEQLGQDLARLPVERELSAEDFVDEPAAH